VAFFRMPAGDRLYLAAIITVAVIAFLPWSRHTQAGPLPVFAWLMAGLMVFAPLVALVRILREPGRREPRGR
jgi:hypothetical protein